MAEERQDSSPLDSTANVAMQTAKKTAKQAKQIADGVKSAKNAAKGAQAASSIATASSGRCCGKYDRNSSCRPSWNSYWFPGNK